MPEELVEISIKGHWVKVRAVDVDGKSVIASGRWIRIAAVHDEAWMPHELKHPEHIIQALERSGGGGLNADIFTFAQKLPSTTPKYRYPMEWDSVAAIRLTSFADWWTRQLPQSTRKNARRAEKRGVVTKIRPFDDELIRELQELNNDSPLRQGVPFAHYGKTFDQVRKDYSSFTDRSDFICAYVGRELVGCLKIVYGETTGAILQLLVKRRHDDKRPATALIVAALECCERKHLAFVTYDRYRYGNQEHTSLMEFKRRTGFEEIMVPRYFVPLTFKGRIGMKLKLHRDLVSILPRPAIAFGRRARTQWYRLKQLDHHNARLRSS